MYVVRIACFKQCNWFLFLMCVLLFSFRTFVEIGKHVADISIVYVIPFVRALLFRSNISKIHFD